MKMKMLNELLIETNGATQLIWHHNYWDGPLTGLMYWNNEKVWFKKIDEYTIDVPWTKDEIKEDIKLYGESTDSNDYIETEYYRIYNVYKLTAKQLYALEFNHTLFQKYVGSHCDYTNNSRVRDKLKDYSIHHKFYNREEQLQVDPINYSSDNIIGQFKC